MDITVFVGLFLLGVFALGILWAEKIFLQKKALLFLSAALIIAALLLRGICIPHETLDYQNFLAKWVAFFRQNGGWSALKYSIGNYNVPYLYFLALFSYSSVPDLYLIKFLSIFFDILLAWGVMRLVSRCSKNHIAAISAFFLTLFLPTVVLNGAYWGQCDSIYAAFAVWSIYFALSGKPICSVAAIALSFAFKLQAIFLMPVYLIFLFTRRVKWWHLAVFPITYALAVLPAILTGRPPLDTLLLYFSQTGSIGGGLNYNSSSVFAFLPNRVSDPGLFSAFGIDAAFLFLFLLYICLYRSRRHASDTALLAVSLMICIGVPFFLPHMHDRYFFLADVFSLALAFVLPQAFPVPFLVSFASLLGYHAYLKMQYLLPMRYGACALIAALLITAVCTALCLSRKKRGAAS